VAHQRIADVANLVIVEIGSDLERHGHVALVLVGQALLGGLECGQQAIEFAGALELAQVLGVRR